MKKFLLCCGGVLLMATMLLMGCKKDNEVKPTINKFFSVENATLVHKNMPEATTDERVTVSMNNNVIPGGSSIATVQTDGVAKKLLIGMKDQDGYYEVSPTTRGDYAFLMMINQDITLEEGQNGFTVRVAIEDGNGGISQIWESTVQLLQVGTGNLQVSLSFDNSVDVDLLLREPNGTLICYYDVTSENGGRLDLDSNAGCAIDNINNENITYGDEAYVEPGRYEVYVDLYSNCNPEVATNFVVTALYQGVAIATASGTNPFSGTFPINAPSNFTNLSNLEPVMTFVIPDNGQKRVKTFDPAPMSETAKEKLALRKE